MWSVATVSAGLAFQHTAARRRLVTDALKNQGYRVVSTHSRPKAAGPLASYGSPPSARFQHTAARRRLERIGAVVVVGFWFQHTAARRRLGLYLPLELTRPLVSTHSRPKAAGAFAFTVGKLRQRFNTQPPEGGWVGFNSQAVVITQFQHTAARRRLGLCLSKPSSLCKFQHTAARRRLAVAPVPVVPAPVVSTHSRPKAAGASLKSLAPSGFAALISLSSQEKCKREYNTAFSVTPAFAIS